MVEKPQADRERQIVDIAYFRAAHIVPRDIWPNLYLVDNYIDLEI